MDNNSNKPLGQDHDGPPQDDATRKKIDKHLSDIDDKISEEDIRNINTSTGAENEPIPHRNVDEEIKELTKDDDEDEPKKEAPSPWEILGE